MTRHINATGGPTLDGLISHKKPVDIVDKRRSCHVPKCFHKVWPLEKNSGSKIKQNAL